MNLVRACASGCLLTVIAACETTGNPREGGLFGWSEAKAQERQAEKRAEVGQAHAGAALEKRRGGAIQRRGRVVERQLLSERARARLAAEGLEQQYRATRSSAELLEEESPTAATASRARVLQERVDFIAGNTALSPAQRRQRLQQLDAELSAARRALAR